MEKKVTIILTEQKARILIDGLYSLVKHLDRLYEKNGIPRTKISADVLEEIYNEVRDKTFI